MTAPTLDLATPTATTILTADQMRDRNHWLRERQKGIGSSDIASIVGVGYDPAVKVWHDKMGHFTETDDDAGEAAYWGTRNEPTVADDWCRRNRSVIETIGLIANVDEPWMLTSLDRRVRECPLDPDRRQNCALEVKTRSAFKSAQWHKDIPDDVMAQTAWQRLVSGYDHIHIAVLIGGNTYHQAVYRRNDVLETYLANAGHEFWHTNVLRGVEPAWNLDQADRLIDMDKKLHPTRSGVADLGLDEYDAVLEYARLSAEKGAAEKALDRAKARLLEIAGGAVAAKFSDHLAYEFARRSRPKCDFEALAEQFPAAYAACVTTTTFDQISIPADVRASATA